MEISYNALNLPQVVTGATGKIKFEHTFSGEQIKKTVEANGDSETRIYLGGVEYVNGNAEIYSHSEGRIFFKDPAIHYQYKIADHLGNTAVLFEDFNDDGVINTESTDPNAPPCEVLQRQFYYSFGMAMEGGWLQNTHPNQEYLYNGKELHDDLGLNWYAYGARMYDATIGRFTGVDPIAEQYAFVTVYNYAENEPIGHIDLWGLQKAVASEAVVTGEKNTASQHYKDWLSKIPIDAQMGLAKSIYDYNINMLQNDPITKGLYGVDDNGNATLSPEKLEVERLAAEQSAVNTLKHIYASQTGGLYLANLAEAASSYSEMENVLFDATISVAQVWVGELFGAALGNASWPYSAKSGANLTKSQLKSISSLEGQIVKHQLKLAEYIKDPMKFDNLGFLKNAPNDAVRQKIIQSRINHLNHEISTFQNSIKKILNEP